MKRRDFLRLVAGGLGGVAAPFAHAASPRRCRDLPGVAHILPTVGSRRMLIKVSLTMAVDCPPVLVVDGRRVRGRRTDTRGLFWMFDVRGLRPGRRHELDLRWRGRRLIDRWPLATFPAPSARPERLRLLMYTCAGGNDIFRLYVPAAARRRLLCRALAFRPDAVVANGDHVYWDLRAGLSALVTGASRIAEEYAGVFDRAVPVLGRPNEDVLVRAVGPQIAGLYGTLLRSVPVFFIRDDHDYSEDDQVTEGLVTFPPDDFMVCFARASQRLYYPEFLPDRRRPADLPGSSAPDRPRGVSEAFGTLRYGRLFEGLLYDCKGFLALAGASQGLVPPAVEAWLHARMARSRAEHVVHMPSNPPGWSAGKFAEWYPDVLGPDGKLTTAIPKPGWQEGWLMQHDRLLAAASATARIPLFVSGDIHSVAEGCITRSGPHDLGANPVVSVISAPLGTGVGWPSVARGTLARPPAALEVDEVVPVEETNGFHLIDFEPGKVTIRHFRWRHGRDPEDAIDTLMPFHVSEYRRSG